MLRVPGRPTTASAPCDTSRTRMARGCSPSATSANSSSRLITIPSMAWLRKARMTSLADGYSTSWTALGSR